MANYKFNPSKARDRLIEGLETLAKEDDLPKVVVDMSLPNPMVAIAICIRALGKENVCAAFDAGDHPLERRLCASFGVDVVNYELDSAVRSLKEIVPDADSLLLRERLRMVMLKCLAEAMNGKVIGLLDLNTLTVGEYAKATNACCDYSLFGELTTFEVIQIAKTMKELPKDSYMTSDQFIEEVHHYIRNDQPLDICIWRDFRRLESGNMLKRMMPIAVYDPLGG